MNASVETLQNCLATIHVEVGSDRISPLRENLIRDFMKDAKVPGFRPGKMPKALVLETCATTTWPTSEAGAEVSAAEATSKAADEGAEGAAGTDLSLGCRRRGLAGACTDPTARCNRGRRGQY